MRTLWIALLVLALAPPIAPSIAAAQDDAAADDTGAEPIFGPADGGPTSDDAAFEASLAEGEIEAPDDDWQPPTIMVIARRDAPEDVVAAVRVLLASAGGIVDQEGYEREARSRGLPPESPEAMQAILADMHPDLDLVVVVGTNRPTRATLVSLDYHDRFGLEILEEEHSIRGFEMTDDSRERTLAETRLALAVITRPRGGLQQVGGGVEPGERAPGLAVHVAISAGIGFGTREFEVPSTSGILALSTAAFAATALQLSIDVEPIARGPITIGADLEYQTSLGLVTTDMRIDATTRDTSSRSQRLAAGLRFTYRLAESQETVSLGGALSWSALTFSSEAPVTLPDYTLQGPVLALGVVIPVGEILSIALWPEATWIVDVGSALASLGVSSSGAAIGGTVRIRLQILAELFAELAYRESHAFLGSSAGGGGSDVERFGTVRLVYRP